MTKIVSSIVALSLLSLTPRLAEAACDTVGSDQAYGDFWVVRTTAGSCEIWMSKISCVASGGFRTRTSTLITTLSGAVDTACESTAGYEAAIASATAKWTPGAGYGCDSSYLDADGDAFPVCIDEDDLDPASA